MLPSRSLAIALGLFSATAVSQPNGAFLSPYLNNWFTDILPQDRDHGSSLTFLVRQYARTDLWKDENLTENDLDIRLQKTRTHLFDILALDISVHNASTVTTDGMFMRIWQPPFPNHAIVLHLSPAQSEGSDRYTSRRLDFADIPNTSTMLRYLPTELNVPPHGKFKPTPPLTINLNDDQIPDFISISPDAVEVHFGTAYGPVKEQHLGRFIFNVRLGYIAGRYLGLGRGAQEEQQPASLVQVNAPSYSPSTASASIPSKSAAHYHMLSRLLWESAQDNSYFDGSFISLGFSLGLVDGRSVHPFATSSARDIATRGETIEDIAIRLHPLLPSLRDPNTGRASGIAELFASNVWNHSNILASHETSLNFVKKLSDNTNGEPPTHEKELLYEDVGRVLLCNPAILTGEVLAFLIVLTTVRNPELVELASMHSSTELWRPVRKVLFQAVSSRGNVADLSRSPWGVASLQVSQGLEHILEYHEAALAGIAYASGQRNAAVEILKFIRTRFPVPASFDSATSIADAQNALTAYIGGLHVLIEQQRSTITGLRTNQENLLKRINELEAEKKTLQEILARTQRELEVILASTAELTQAAAKRAGELEETIKRTNELLSSAKNTSDQVGRLAGLLGDITEVAYWGSSVGVVHTSGKAIVDGVKRLFGSKTVTRRQ